MGELARLLGMKVGYKRNFARERDPLTAVYLVARMEALLREISTGDYPPPIKGRPERQLGWDAAIAMMIALLDAEDPLDNREG